jgi:hypothetical protein
MAEKSSVGIDDLIATSTEGVLRALDARRIGQEKLSTSDLVRSGFSVEIKIICGGRGPEWISEAGRVGRVAGEGVK